MERVHDSAVVLKIYPFSERHQAIVALTKNHGRLTVRALNSIHSRRFAGALEPFVASEWDWVEQAGKDLHRLDEVKVMRRYEGLRKDFERLALASSWNEVLLRVAPENEPAEPLFRLHTNALAALEESNYPGADLRLLTAYFGKLLHFLGNHPRLQECLRCAHSLSAQTATASLLCRIKEAGWICPDCWQEGLGVASEIDAYGIQISPLAALDFHRSLTTPIRRFPNEAQASQGEHRALFRFIEALFIFHVPGFDQKRLKSLKFLRLETD